MKVKIGSYRHKVMWGDNLQKKYLISKFGSKYYDDSYKMDILEKIFISFCDKLQWLLDLVYNRWILNFDRKVNIKIHNHDLWSMDHTLALIILPMLKKLKETKTGIPGVDMDDVPEDIRSLPADVFDSNSERRWDYILDEIIWTFEQIANEDSEDVLYSKNTAGGLVYDKEAGDAREIRISNGLRLFGTYYGAFWT